MNPLRRLGRFDVAERCDLRWLREAGDWPARLRFSVQSDPQRKRSFAVGLELVR